MSSNQRRIAMTVLATVAVVGTVALLLGSASAASVQGGAPSPVAGLATASTSARYYNWSGPQPNWNQGNLCTLTQSGSNVSCVYNGGSAHYGWDHGGSYGCGCQGNNSLIENISGTGLTITIQVSNLQYNHNNLYLNFMGKHDTIVFDLSGCQGGTVNITMSDQYTTLDLNYTASHVRSSIYFYSDHNIYNAVVSGSMDHTATYFVSAQPRFLTCPIYNASRDDTYNLTTTGWGDSQGLIYVNAVGYNTAVNWVWGPHWNLLAFANTTTFGCGWSFPPPSTCHHGWGSPELVAATREL